MAVPQLEAQGTLGAAATEGRQASPLLVRGARPLRAVNSRIASRSDTGGCSFLRRKPTKSFTAREIEVKKKRLEQMARLPCRAAACYAVVTR